MKIPLREEQKLIPGGDVSVRESMEAPADLVALNRFGAAAMDTSMDIAAANERLQQRRDAIELVRKTVEYKDRVKQIDVDSEKDLNEGGMDISDVTKKATDNMKAASDELLTDVNPRIIEELRNRHMAIQTESSHSIAIRQANAEYKFNEETKQTVILKSGEAAAVHADNPEAVKLEVDDMLSQLKILGPVSPMAETNATAHVASVAIQAAIATEDVAAAKQILSDFAAPLKAKGIYDELTVRLKSAEETENENTLYNEAMLAGKRGGGVDWGVAQAYLYNPENREKYKMKPLQIAQLKRVMDDQRLAEQESVYNTITAKAIQNPNAAMRDIEILMKNPRGFDAPVFRQLYESIKRGQQADVQFNDQAKMVISTNILAGAYKDKNELTNAIFSAGITRGNDTFLKASVDLFDKQGIKYGKQNNFKAAEEAIDAEITSLTTRNKGAKKHLIEQKNLVLNAASDYMIKNGISVDDPQAAKILNDMWELERKSFFRKTVEQLNPWGAPPEPFVPAPTPGRPESRGAIGRRIIKTKTYPDGRIKRQWSDGTVDEVKR